MSRVRLVHNVAADLKVNVSLDGKIRARDVKYKDVSDYLEIRPGRHHIRICNAETGDVIKQLCASVVTRVSTTYTIIVAGKIDDLCSLKLLPIEDAKEKPASGKVLVRFIHAAAGTIEEGVDVYSRTVVNGQNQDVKVFPDYKYTQASKYVEVDPGMLSLIVSAAGSTDGIGPINVMVDKDQNYTFIATGLPGDEKFPVSAIQTLDKAMAICL